MAIGMALQFPPITNACTLTSRFGIIDSIGGAEGDRTPEVSVITFRGHKRSTNRVVRQRVHGNS